MFDFLETHESPRYCALCIKHSIYIHENPFFCKKTKDIMFYRKEISKIRNLTE